MSDVKVKNGLRIKERSFKNLDGRLAIAKQFKGVKRSLISALGGEVSIQQEMLIDRCTFLLYKITVFEKLSLHGEAPRIDEFYLAWVNCLRRTLEVLGLERKAKDITLEALLKNGTD